VAGSPSPLAERHVREFARSCVRAGLLGEQQMYDEVALAVATELPERPTGAGDLAQALVEEFRAELARDARSWPEVTDYDRLQEAFTAIQALGVVVLQGCDDHWAAKAILDQRAAVGDPPRGIAWFTAPDVWHAVDEGMLEVNVWHADTANAAPGDPLLDDVLAVFAAHDLDAHFDEGRIEVSAHWQRRP
jgi:hypothetical protein